MNRKEFYGNLLLTQIYCEQQLLNHEKNPASILRSINPTYNGKPIFEFDKQMLANQECDVTQWQFDSFLEKSAINNLFEKQLIHKNQIINPIDTNRSFEGAILVAEIDANVADGASEWASNGFIDVFDTPPIDTWFYKTQLLGEREERFLFAWVPQQFVPLVQEAIHVNCMDCLHWFDDLYPLKYNMFLD